MEQDKLYAWNPQERDEIIATLRGLFISNNNVEIRRSNRLLAPLGVNHTASHCLLYLHASPEGAEPSRIADDLAVLRQTMTSVLDSLEKRGYIERVPHPTDRRRFLVRLLPAGAELAVKAEALQMEYHRRITQHFTPEELRVYADVRSRLPGVKNAVLAEIEQGRQPEPEKK